MITPKTTSATANLCLFAIAIIVLWGYALKTSGGAETPKPKPFQVVNQYNGCNVVRYETSYANPRYAYILDCKNSKENK